MTDTRDIIVKWAAQFNCWTAARENLGDDDFVGLSCDSPTQAVARLAIMEEAAIK